MAWRLLDLIYPRSCYGCGLAQPPATQNLCWDCMSGLMLIQPPFCSICGNPVHGHIDHDYVCSLCTADRPGFLRAISAGRYDGLLRDMVMGLKYHHSLWVVQDLAHVMQSAVEVHYNVSEIDLVGYVPLYPAKRRERGFNQARLLAEALAAQLGKPLMSRCLVRTRATETQTHLTAAERLTNVRGAFKARWRRWIEGKRVLLVDDVMTTGATVSECARALTEGGALHVKVVTAARR